MADHINGVVAQLTNTPEISGITNLDCNIYKVNTPLNESYQVSYDDLDASQKIIVDEFINLIISLAPTP